MKLASSRIYIALSVLLITALSCSGSLTPAAPTEDLVSLYVTQTLSALVTAAPEVSPIPTIEAAANTAIPSVTLTPGITHIVFPADLQIGGTPTYDVDSRDTASENRAPYGDSYKLNRFERPFTETKMDYLPDVDIISYRIAADQNWYYVFVELSGMGTGGTLTADYAVELDFDRDGHGDYLIWAKPPFASSWTTDGVTVYMDSNNDTGGLSPERADANFSGNGYDQVLIASGRNGLDTDLAWVRIDPRSAKGIQFAFKKSLVGGVFMWGVWADLGLRDPARFNYNDYFSEEQAGSPEKSETKYYPIKAVAAIDNTCRMPFGFKASGYEPLICPLESLYGPTPTPTKVP